MRPNLLRIAVFGVLAAGTAFAQTPATITPAASEGHGVGIKSVLRKRIIKSLNLTADQKQQAKAIRQAAKTQVRPLAQQLKENRQSLAAAVQTGDTAKVQQLAIENGSLRGQLLAVRSDSAARFLALLTPDQKIKARDLLGKKG